MPTFLGFGVGLGIAVAMWAALQFYA